MTSRCGEWKTFCYPLNVSERIINPTYVNWKDAGLIVVKIALRHPNLKSKKTRPDQSTLSSLYAAVMIGATSGDVEL